MVKLLGYAAKILAEQIYTKSNSDIDKIKIYYGLHSILINIFEHIVIFTIAAFSHVFKLTLVMLILMCPFRLYSAGRHCKTLGGCLIVSSSLLVAIPYIAMHVRLDSKYLFMLNILCCIITFLVAPLGTAEHPVTKNRRQKKIVSTGIMLFYLIFSCIVPTPYKEAVMLLSCGLVLTIIPYSKKDISLKSVISRC